jgi:endonuclease YncB( thermonuclease family)
MRLASIVFLLALTVLPSASSAPPVAAADCEFVLGFKAIHDAIPEMVGDCLVPEHHEVSTGNTLQETTAWHGKGGLLVWRKVDNWTAFTDGAHTWVNGPNGLQKRLNAERFPWENDPVAAPPVSADMYPVRQVVDGDTLKVELAGGVETIRIIGLDTPEVVDPGSPVQCYGPEASARARELLEGQSVRLVADPSQGERDKYGRLLRYVELADGVDFGLTMIRDGYAHEYTYATAYERQAAYRAAEASARDVQRGFWAPATCGGDTRQGAPSAATPTVPPSAVGTGVAPISKDDCPQTHPIKGNQGSRSNIDWIYHVPGSRSYAATDPEECFATAADAQAAGYRAPQN